MCKQSVIDTLYNVTSIYIGGGISNERRIGLTENVYYKMYSCKPLTMLHLTPLLKFILLLLLILYGFLAKKKLIFFGKMNYFQSKSVYKYSTLFDLIS